MQLSKYEQLWNSCSVLEARKPELDRICAKLAANRSRYETIEKALGIPWFFVACVHERESGGNFSTYLGNGEPLDRVTRLVPKGRGPFKDWESGAIDALRLEKLDKVKSWDITAILSNWEAYNGLGYKARGVPSPYLWSFTNQYTAGKFVADRKYSATAVDAQAGCAALLKTLQSLIPDLLVPQPKEPSMAAATSSAPVIPAVAAATTSFSTLWTGIAGMFGSISAGTVIMSVLSQLDPGAVQIMYALLGIAGTGMGLVASAYHVISHVSATNNATIALGEKTINTVQGWLNQPQTDFTAANAIEPQPAS